MHVQRTVSANLTYPRDQPVPAASLSTYLIMGAVVNVLDRHRDEAGSKVRSAGGEAGRSPPAARRRTSPYRHG